MSESIVPPLKRCRHCGVEYPATTEYFYKSALSRSSWCKPCLAERYKRLMSTPHEFSPSELKRCARCKEMKPATPEFFRRNNAQLSGLDSKCKDCITIVEGRIPPSQREKIPDGFKRCKKCQQVKPHEEFHRSGSKGVGRVATCKACLSKNGVARETLPSGMKRCTGCKEIQPVEQFSRRNNVRDGRGSRCRTCKIRYYQEHHEENLAKQAIYRAKNKDIIRERSLAHYNTHKESFRQRQREQRAKNPHMNTAAFQRRRARKCNLPDTFIASEWEACLDWWNNTCAYCGQQRSFWHTLGMEHFIPLNSPVCPGTVKENIVPACITCNSSKGIKPAREWLLLGRSKKKTEQILAKIQAYFDWLKLQDDLKRVA